MTYTYKGARTVADEQQTQQDDQQQDSGQQGDQQQDDRDYTEKPEVEDKHKEKAEEMRKEYVEERPTVIMPGSGGTVAGTAVNEWLDDDGSPKFGDESESAADTSGSDDVDTGRTDEDKSYGDTVTDDKERNERIRKAHGDAQAEEAQNGEDAARNDEASNDVAQTDDERKDAEQKAEAKKAD